MEAFGDAVGIVQLTEQLHASLAQREAELLLEQAVHGLDHLTEVELQALLSDGLALHHRVTREAFYPSSTGSRSHRPRCDLVLTPQGQALANDAMTAEATCPPEAAFWLELKVAHQLRPSSRSNPRYGHQFRRALIADLKKLRADPQVLHAAIALVVFTDSAATLDKDLALFELLLGEAGLFGFRVVRSVEIVDRIGHRLCSVAVWPLL